VAQDARRQGILKARGLTKAFGGPPVLREVDFELFPGEVHAVVGENGAGKSTLLKLLTGVHEPDAGEIAIDGAPVAIPSPAAAQALGIAHIFQEPTLFPDLSVAENIFVGRLPVGERFPVVRWRAMRQEARALLDSIGARLSPEALVGTLSVAEQQLVEIAAALSQKARYVLMDEPTASLTPREVERLFRIIRDLKDRGAGIVFVNHRLEEVFAIADRVTVLRDGGKVGTWTVGEVSRDEVIRAMVGRELARWAKQEMDAERRRGGPAGEVLLEVENLGARGRFAGVSLHVRRGEIVALAGLVGAGRSEVAQAIFGIERFHTGAIRFKGKSVAFRSPREALAAGIAYLPEDRQHQGLILPFPVSGNITLSILGEISRSGWLLRRKEQAMAKEQVERLGVRTPGISTPVQHLSGGNQQKVLVGKLLVTRPEVLILDEPTRGVDVGAKAEIHRLIVELARQGIGVLMISSDLSEVLALADRVLVMRDGRLAGELDRAQATEEAVMRLAVGGAASA
jgi:ABC-type sugar transport system, ATPase component